MPVRVKDAIQVALDCRRAGWSTRRSIEYACRELSDRREREQVEDEVIEIMADYNHCNGL